MPHVVVVGVGVVGAAIARAAARAGAAVTLLERARPGAGATGSSFAWIGRASGAWPGGAADLRGGVLPHWRRLERELAGVRVRWTGSLTWSAQDVDAPGAPRAAGGEEGDGEVQVLDAARIAALEPNLRRPPVRAVRTTSDAAVDPLAVTRALVDDAAEHGAHVRCGVEVTALRTAGGRVTGVGTGSGALAADAVVVAAGAEVRRLCAGLGLDVPVEASPAVLMSFAAPRGLVRTLVAGPDVEVREGADGSLLATAEWSGSSSPQRLEEVARRTASAVAATFRGAEELVLRSARVGVRPMPVDAAPVVGPVPGAEGLYVAAMHSGVTLAPLVGHLVAREVVEGVEAEELRRCRPARFPAALSRPRSGPAAPARRDR